MKKKKTVNPRFRTVENSRAYCSLSGRLAVGPTVCSDWGLLHLNYLPTSGHNDHHHGHDDHHHGHDDQGGVDTKSFSGVQNESYWKWRECVGNISNTFNTCQHFLVNTKQNWREPCNLLTEHCSA